MIKLISRLLNRRQGQEKTAQVDADTQMREAGAFLLCGLVRKNKELVGDLKIGYLAYRNKQDKYQGSLFICLDEQLDKELNEARKRIVSKYGGLSITSDWIERDLERRIELK